MIYNAFETHGHFQERAHSAVASWGIEEATSRIRHQRGLPGGNEQDFWFFSGVLRCIEDMRDMDLSEGEDGLRYKLWRVRHAYDCKFAEWMRYRTSH